MADTSSNGGSSSSKSLLFMMIALFAGVAILLGGGMFMASRILHSMELRVAGDKKTIRTPIGDFRTEKPSDVGPVLPVFPGAALVLPGDDALAAALRNRTHAQVLTTTYHTSGSRDSVANWYAEHLGAEFTQHSGTADLQLPEIFKDAAIGSTDVVFQGERAGQLKLVALVDDGGGTRITLARFDRRQMLR
jgi:hypothetical protein